MRPSALLLALVVTTASWAAEPKGVVVIELANGSTVALLINADGSKVSIPATLIRIKPPAPANPYAEPSAALRATVQPLRDMAILRAHGQSLAAVFAGTADAIVAGKITDAAQLDKAMADAGSKLDLKGKYPELAQSLDAIFQASIARPGDELRPLTNSDAAVLRAVAWALWREG